MKGIKPIAINMLDKQLANTPSVKIIDIANAITAIPVIIEPIFPIIVLFTATPPIMIFT